MSDQTFGGLLRTLRMGAKVKGFDDTEAKKVLNSDAPSSHPEHIEAFKEAEEHLLAAVNAVNSHDYPSLKDDCIYLVGLSQFFSNSYMEAAKTFFNLGKRTTSEKALWMAIVSIEPSLLCIVTLS